MQWVINNAGAVIAVLGAVFGFTATWVMYGARITQLEKDSEKKDKKIDELERALALHMSDTSLHIDPHRDEERWKDFKREIFGRFDGMVQRFDTTDRKIENLMIATPGKS
jgi:hypothetical protein